METMDRKVLLTIVAVIVLVVAAKQGGLLTFSIYSSDPDYVAYSLSSSSYTLSSSENIYSFCSPSRIRMDFHQTGTSGTCNPIVPATTDLTSISAVCDKVECPDFRYDTITSDGFFSQLYHDGARADLELTDSVNTITIYSFTRSGELNYLREDIQITYNSGSNSFTVKDKTETRNIASTLDATKPFRFKLKLQRSPGQFGYAQVGYFYKYVPQQVLNGVCGTTNNVCLSGTSTDTADSSTNYLWSCTGSNGGTTASCSEPILSAPATPTGLTVTGTTSNSISLSWTSVSGADKYAVFCGTSHTDMTDCAGAGMQSSISSTTQTSTSDYVVPTTTFTHTGLQSGRTYYYRVQSLSPGQNSCALYTCVLSSSVNTATTSSTTIPPTPTGTSATATSQSSISINWNEVPGAVGYNVYSSTSPNGPFVLVRSG